MTGGIVTQFLGFLKATNVCFGSAPLRRHNDDPRVFRQLHGGIKVTHQAVLHDTRHGYWTPEVPTKVRLYGGRRRAGGQFQGRQLRLGGDLLVSGSTSRVPRVNFGGRHGVIPLNMR